MTLLLQKAGFQVELASNGQQALEANECERFDLILMDVQMPEMDGVRATRLIRAREKVTGRRVPIVAVTADAADGQERRRCLNAGMDDYLTKPIRKAELFSAIARLLGDPPARTEVTSGPGNTSGPEWLLALERMGYERQGIVSLVRIFMDSAPDRMQDLRQRIAAGDAQQVQQIAHALKGAIMPFAVQRAITAAQRLEQLGQQQQLDQAGRAFAELEAEMGQFLVSLRRFLGEQA
jgi:CheY-like chemotaxis protein/HPt (histidine-containing phosphotransfer) domain-containing protein